MTESGFGSWIGAEMTDIGAEMTDIDAWIGAEMTDIGAEMTDIDAWIGAEMTGVGIGARTMRRKLFFNIFNWISASWQK